MAHPAVLRAKAEKEGSVRMIVGLRTPFVPEGQLARAGALLQRGGIAATGDRVLSRLSSVLGGVPVKRFETLPYLALRGTPQALEALVHDPDVVFVQEDHVARPQLRESVPLIHAPQAWEAGWSGAGQTVAILDCGVDKTHPFLAGKVVSEACYSTTDEVAGCRSVCPGGASESIAEGAAMPPLGGEYGDRFYHGTHVAGIAAGRGADFSGVARDASLIAVQVFSFYPANAPEEQALTWESDQIRGLERVFLLRETHQIAAVNMSLGGGRYEASCDGTFPAMAAAIESLRSVGIATVISSGNNGYGDATTQPGCLSAALTVGATTKADAVAPYSNSASFVDLLAPGSAINSSIPGGAFVSWNGTSMAAPHVAGALAVLRSAYPAASVGSLEAALKQTGIPVADTPRGLGAVAAITKPRIQVKEALDALPSVTGFPSPSPMPFPTLVPTATPVPLPTPFPPGVRHVTPGGSGRRDGSSWENALPGRELRGALAVAVQGTEFWVARGVYKPAERSADLTASFLLRSGVAVYGGFSGDEPSRNARNWGAHKTVFTGDLEENDQGKVDGVTVSADQIEGENSLHVVRGGEGGALLDGVVVCGGDARSGSGGGMINTAPGALAVTNCTFVGNRGTLGGGMANGSSSPLVTSCTFAGNSAHQGAGMYNDHGTPTVTSCTFSGNKGSSGGGMNNREAASQVRSCTFVANFASFGGGGMYNGKSAPAVTSCTFSNNRSGTGGA